MENESATIGAQVNQPVAQSLIDPSPPVPAADDKKATPAATDETAEVVEETTEQAEAKKQSKFQRRLERQKTARIQAETETRLLREQVARLEAQSTPKASEQTGEPKRENFDDYEAYVEARAEWRADQKVEQRLKERDEASQRKEQQGRQSAEQGKAAQAWGEREKTFEAATKDYADVVTPYVEDDLGRLSDVARREIISSEVGPQLLYHLAQNSDVADEIAELSPRDQKAELAKLATKLKAPAAKLKTDAPAPMKPVPQGRTTPNGYRETMSQDEYNKWKHAQLEGQRH